MFQFSAIGEGLYNLRADAQDKSNDRVSILSGQYGPLQRLLALAAQSRKRVSILSGPRWSLQLRLCVATQQANLFQSSAVPYGYSNDRPLFDYLLILPIIFIFIFFGSLTAYESDAHRINAFLHLRLVAQVPLSSC